MRATLGRHQRMNLIHDHRIDPAKTGGSIGGQQQVQRLRRRDQDLCRMPPKQRAFLLRCVAGAYRDPRLTHRHARAPRHICNGGQGRAQVPLHVHGQRLQRTDVDNAARSRLRRRLQHQPVQAPQKSRQRLARARRRQDQRVLAACDRRPAQHLRRGRPVEDRTEPLRRYRMKQLQHVVLRRLRVAPSCLRTRHAAPLLRRRFPRPGLLHSRWISQRRGRCSSLRRNKSAPPDLTTRPGSH